MTPEQQRVEEIAGKLTAAQRRAILAGDGEFKPRIGRQGYTLTVKRELRRLGLLECEDAVRAIWNYRLAPLGLAIRAHLRAKEGV